jgi:hypothetical protein
MNSKKVLVTLLASAALWISNAQAVAILTPGNIPQSDENVLLNTGLTGTVVFGTTNQTGLNVRFTGGETITAPANGQARIEAVDGTLASLTIDVPGGTFSSLILNPDASVTGTADFTAVTTSGTTLFPNVALGGSGSNFFTLTTSTPGERFISVGVVADSPLVFTDVAQVRLGGAQLTTVPDGGMTVAMLGLGLGLLAFAKRKFLV